MAAREVYCPKCGEAEGLSVVYATYSTDIIHGADHNGKLELHASQAEDYTESWIECEFCEERIQENELHLGEIE